MQLVAGGTLYSCAVCADFALLGETPIDRRHPEREEYR